MKFLKHNKYAIFLSLAMVVLQLMVFAPKVMAREAQCYMQTFAGIAQDNCSSFQTIIQSASLRNIFPENCYELQGMVLSNGKVDNIVPIEKDCRQAPFNITDAAVHYVQCPGEEPKEVPITQTSSQACGTDPDNITNPENNSPVNQNNPTPASTGTPSATGAAPISNNAQTADPSTPQISRENNGGFDSVDDKCNVGNQGRDCAVTDRLNAIANVLSAGVGVIVVIMIIVSGIQYTMAGSDPQKIATAKGHILNAIIALIAFFFLYAFLQWLVPGGIF